MREPGSNDENIATVNGNVLTLHAPGYAIIIATQPGNDQYMAALNVMKILQVTEPVGISDYAVSPINVWPNSTTGILNVQFTMNNVQAKTTAIQVFDTFRRLLQTTDGVGANNHSPLQTDANGSSAQTQIDLSPLATGVYLVKAVAEGNVVAVR